MTAISDLMDMVEDSTVLVFPTEESARAFSSLYVMTRKRGLLASSCIAFDNFASLFIPEEKGKTQSGEAERLIFSSYAATALADKLRYFISPSYPEMQSRLPSFFRSILPYLDDALSLPQKNSEAIYDLMLLKRKYDEFLSSMKLYESAFSRIIIPDCLDKDYAIIMPEAFPKESRIVKALEGNDRIRLISDLKDNIPVLHVYDNEKNEIRALFAAIRRLCDSGVTLDEIAVSVTALERLRPYIEDEAYLFGIPLDFREGVLLASTAPGAFLSGLSDIFTSSYSLDSLKAFFLNPSIPFKEPEVLRKFIADAVRFSITSAPDRRTDRYMKLPKESGREYYRLLRLTLDSLMTESDPSKIESLLHTLMSGLLVDEEFHGNAEDESVYSFAMKSLSDFVSSYYESEKAGFGSDRAVFPLFITYFSTSRYVPRNRVEGIAVYPFTQDAAVPYRYRFVIALNGKEGSAIVKKASFLSDYELVSERAEEDITKVLLSLYGAMTENLTLSASYDTYAGFALPMTFMLDSAVKSASPADEPLRAEEHGLIVGHILPVQRRGYEAGLFSSLRKREKKDDMTYDRKGLTRSFPVSLSFSSYNSYTHCPYLYALQYSFSLKDLPSYEPVDMDNLEIGSRLHSILERYYKHPFRDIPQLFDEEMDAWANGKRFSSDGGLHEMPSFASRPTRFLIRYLRSRYLPRLEEVVRKMDEISIPISDEKGLEVPLAASFPELGFALDGRVDRIAMSKDGASYIIYDYKKGRIHSDTKAEKSYQFHIYSLLLGASDDYPLPVSASFFISLLDGDLVSASQSPGISELKKSLEACAEAIAGGDWHAISNDNNCKGCSYRGICRRRFSVR